MKKVEDLTELLPESNDGKLTINYPDEPGYTYMYNAATSTWEPREVS